MNAARIDLGYPGQDEWQLEIYRASGPSVTFLGLNVDVEQSLYASLGPSPRAAPGTDAQK
jgi:hypothetical protein